MMKMKKRRPTQWVGTGAVVWFLRLSLRKPSAYLGAIIATALLTSTAQAYCRATTEKPPEGSVDCPTEGIPLAWQHPCISYSVIGHAAADSASDNALEQNGHLTLDRARETVADSFKAWTDVQCNGKPIGLKTKLEEVASIDELGPQEELPEENSIIFVNDWQQRGYSPNDFAITTIHTYDTGKIKYVNVEINEEMGAWGDCCPDGECSAEASNKCENQGTVDLRNVLTHEAGHFFGLYEELRLVDSTMYENANIGDTNKRTLEKDDRAGICSIYPKGSLSQKCEYMPYQPSENIESHGCSAPGQGSGRPVDLAALACVGGLFTLMARRRRSK